jgi:Carboxypeptidase regulatory-like domain
MKFASFARGAVVLFAAVLPARVSAQRYEIHGHVVDADRHPVPNADVQVLQAGAVAITGQTGAFDLGPLSRGTYRVRVRRIGFRAVTIRVTVPMSQPDLVVTVTEIPAFLDTVRTQALEQDLPRVFERAREHLGALVFGPDLVKEYPGLSADDILQTDSTLYPFLKGASFRGCGMFVYIDGKPMPPPMFTPSPNTAMHPIFLDRHIRDFVRMRDVAAIEVFRYAKGKIFEPWVPLGSGEDCRPLVLIWTKGYKQRPYKGP